MTKSPRRHKPLPEKIVSLVAAFRDKPQLALSIDARTEIGAVIRAAIVRGAFQ